MFLSSSFALHLGSNRRGVGVGDEGFNGRAGQVFYIHRGHSEWLAVTLDSYQLLLDKVTRLWRIPVLPPQGRGRPLKFFCFSFFLLCSRVAVAKAYFSNPRQQQQQKLIHQVWSYEMLLFVCSVWAAPHCWFQTTLWFRRTHQCRHAQMSHSSAFRLKDWWLECFESQCRVVC